MACLSLSTKIVLLRSMDTYWGGKLKWQVTVLELLSIPKWSWGSLLHAAWFENFPNSLLKKLFWWASTCYSIYNALDGARTCTILFGSLYFTGNSGSPFSIDKCVGDTFAQPIWARLQTSWRNWVARISHCLKLRLSVSWRLWIHCCITSFSTGFVKLAGPFDLPRWFSPVSIICLNTLLFVVVILQCVSKKVRSLHPDYEAS